MKDKEQTNKIHIVNVKGKYIARCDCGAIDIFSSDVPYFLRIPKPIRLGWYKHNHENKSLTQVSEEVGIPYSTLYAGMIKFELTNRNVKASKKNYYKQKRRK